MFKKTTLLLIVALAFQMIERAEAQQSSKRPYTVALLIFNGVELLDIAGPAEVFIVSDHGKAFRVVTVSTSTKPIKTMGGITVTPDYSYSDAPKADIIVVPGGAMSNVNEDGVSWIKKAHKTSKVTM